MSDPRSEVVHLNRRLDELLALPEAESLQRFAQDYQAAAKPALFAHVLFMRLLAEKMARVVPRGG
ncbi:MAG TPA: hypothetical protein VL689_00430 [Paraburkholderia sp.]|jgi:hypothetical protein|nr:hypothetical protein [Paraburkholderia sp.]